MPREISRPLLTFVGESQLRRSILGLLSSGPKTPTKLATLEKKHVSHVSRALAELKGRGLVEYSRIDSRERYYRVTAQGYAVFIIVMRGMK